MRKLSKKISMLMVLAMLVSLFSGVVSASAASVWSFYNKTADESIVAYADETYPMENDQFADFDLYKSGEVVDTDVYTVVYESSDEEVVWVNAKSGKLRAQKDAEIGATAEITAHITNKVTGAKADRSFTIEIVAAEVEEPAEVVYAFIPEFGEETFTVGKEYTLSGVVTADGEEIEAEVAYFIGEEEIEGGVFVPAKAGEVAIVAVAVIGEEVVEFEEIVCEAVDAVATKIVDVKQKDAKTVEIIFDAKISAEEADKIELYLGTVVKNNYKKAVKVKDNVVTFESYATFGNGKTWTFVYGDSKLDLKSSQGEVAKVVITGPSESYLKSNGEVLGGTEITFECYDALDVKVNMPTDGSAYIDWHVDNPDLASITTITGKNGEDLPAILFNEADKMVALSGTYHTGKTNEETWEEITFEIDAVVVVSIDNNDPVMVGLGKVGVAKSDVAATSDDAYKTLVVPADTDNFKLFVKFLYDDKDKTQKLPNQLGNEGFDDKGNLIVTYESTDPAKLIVDQNTGELIPIEQGAVDVNINLNGEYYDSVTVTVGPAVASTNPVVKTNTSWISNSTELKQSIEITATGKDNYQSDCGYRVTGVEVKASPYNPNKAEEKAIRDALVGTFIAFDGTNNKVTVSAVYGDDEVKVLKVGNYKLELTVKGFDNKEYKATVSIVVKGAKADDEIKAYAVEWVGGNGAYNTAANKDTANLDAKVEFKIVGKNAAGVPVKYVNAEAVSGSISVKFGTKPVEGVVFDGEKVSLNLYKTADNGAYTVSGSAVKYTGIDNGVYVISGKIGNIAIPNTTFNVDNNQAKPAISVENKAISIKSGDDLNAALVGCFKAPEAKDGYTFSEITLVNPKISESLEAGKVGEYSVYVKTVQISQIFGDKVVFTYTVDVKTSIAVSVTQ